MFIGGADGETPLADYTPCNRHRGCRGCRRPGVLETFGLGRLSFTPHHPRLLTAQAIRPHTEDGRDIRLPMILQDGAMLSAVVAVEVSPKVVKGDFLERCAHDLREVQALMVPFEYTYVSRGAVHRRAGVAWAPLALMARMTPMTLQWVRARHGTRKSFCSRMLATSRLRNRALQFR